MYISKSSLAAFLQCPKKFEYRHIDRLKGEKSDAMLRGSEVHEFCAEFYDHLKFTNEHFTINENFVEDFLESCLEQSIPYIKNFINFERDRWKVCKNLYPKDPKKYFFPLLREEKFVSDTLEQVTILDRLDLRLDGNYTLIEIKTSKFSDKPWKKTELRREMAFEKNTAEASPEFQKNFPNDIMNFVIYFPRSNDVMMENFHWQTFRALDKALEKMRWHIAQNKFPCNVRYHCRYCEFNRVCDMEFE